MSATAQEVKDGGLTERQAKWLHSIRLSSDRSSGYPGTPQDLVPAKVAASLRKLGFIEEFIPYNLAHKQRWVITSAGRIALVKSGAK